MAERTESPGNELNSHISIAYVMSENRSRMPSLQYSFRKGRSCYGGRITAVLLSCMLMAVLTGLDMEGLPYRIG